METISLLSEGAGHFKKKPIDPGSQRVFPLRVVYFNFRTTLQDAPSPSRTIRPTKSWMSKVLKAESELSQQSLPT